MTTSRTGLTRRNRRRFHIAGPVRLRYARSGVALVWVAIMGIMLISLVGLAMDAAVVYLAGSHLQIAADAASLAGAQLVRDLNPIVPREAARYIALENKALGTPVYLDRNDANTVTGEIVLGRYHRFANSEYCVTEPCCAEADAPCFFPTLTSPNAVRVRARRTTEANDGQIPLVFGKAPMINVIGVDVARGATAMISGGTGAGLITLDPNGPCTLEVSGSVNLDLTSAPGYNGDTAIQVNSDNSCAFCVNGGENTEIHAPETNIVGSGGECNGYDIDGNPIIDSYLNPDSPYMPDPLAYLDPPPIGPDKGSIRGAGYYSPGYYSGGLDINGNASVVVTLGPGIYVFGTRQNKGALQVNGGAGLIATNVMFYIESGEVNLNGDGNINITPMTDEINTNSDYIGISIFQARDNFEEATINGTGNMHLEGTYYFPNNRLKVTGDGIALGNQLITWQLDLSGNGTFTIEYDGRFPSPGSKVFLVQ